MTHVITMILLRIEAFILDFLAHTASFNNFTIACLAHFK